MNDEVQGSSMVVGKIFAIGVGLLFLMVAVGVGIMFLVAKEQADNRARHPVIGQPSEIR